MGQAERKRAEELKEQQVMHSSRLALVRFLVLFVAFAVGLFAIFYFWSGFVEGFQLWTASTSAWILSIFGFSVQISGTVYSSSNLAIQIIPECTGLYEMIILSAILLAYPAIWWKKLVGIVGGMAILLFLNLVRLLVLALIGMRDPQLMEWVHLYLWQLTLIIFVVGLFFAWLSWVRGRPTTALSVTPAPDASPGPEAGPREEKKPTTKSPPCGP
jgi:exosortase H (IPTLxxWG-CTERM-specific)